MTFMITLFRYSDFERFSFDESLVSADFFEKTIIKIKIASTFSRFSSKDTEKIRFYLSIG